MPFLNQLQEGLVISDSPTHYISITICFLKNIVYNCCVNPKIEVKNYSGACIMTWVYEKVALIMAKSGKETHFVVHTFFFRCWGPMGVFPALKLESLMQVGELNYYFHRSKHSKSRVFSFIHLNSPSHYHRLFYFYSYPPVLSSHKRLAFFQFSLIKKWRKEFCMTLLLELSGKQAT